MNLLWRFLPIFVLTLGACAEFPEGQEGDKGKEAELRKFVLVPGKSSLYLCRPAILLDSDMKSVVRVDNQPLGTLKRNTFVHAVLRPGTHDVVLKNGGPSGYTHAMTIDARPDEVRILWVGVTAKGFGVLTVDHFESEAEARACVSRAAYMVPSRQ
ncbi:MAG TPA: hypothetical protein VLW55_07660 [Burkholderiaceae bacterium]|nr:hypothetical protein [Burkholderiaceae bacterium]